MSAARVLDELTAAGAELTAGPGGLQLQAPRGLPPTLLARAREVKPALLVVASGRWRDELAAWSPARRERWADRAAERQATTDAPAELCERLAYLEVAELPDDQADVGAGPAAPSAAELSGAVRSLQASPPVASPLPRAAPPPPPATAAPLARAALAALQASWDREARAWGAYLVSTGHPAAKRMEALLDALGPRPGSTGS